MIADQARLSESVDTKLCERCRICSKVEFVRKSNLFESRMCCKVEFVPKSNLFESRICSKVEFVRKYLLENDNSNKCSGHRACLSKARSQVSILMGY
jgi:hypothetical protein